MDFQVIVWRINSSNIFSSINWISVQKEFKKRSIESATGYRRKLIRVDCFMTCPILYFELFQIFESRMIRVEISCSMRDTLVLVHYLLYTMEIRQIFWVIIERNRIPYPLTYCDLDVVGHKAMKCEAYHIIG